jgi:hypothetical protein
MKYLGNYVTSSLINNERLTNRIRLAVTAMLKLDEAGYDESLDAFAANGSRIKFVPKVKVILKSEIKVLLSKKQDIKRKFCLVL